MSKVITPLKQQYIDLKPLWNDKQSIFKVAASDRSDGKTTGLEILAIQSWRESGKIATFSRRWSTEFTDDVWRTFIANLEDAIARGDVPADFLGTKWEFRGSIKKGTRGLWIDDKKAVTFMPLSMISRYKSSFDWKTHRHLFIDEYIPLDNMYCPNELVKILEAYQTIDRKHYDNICIIACNKISYANPLFQGFRIQSLRNGFNRFQNGRLLVFRWDSKVNAKLAAASPFGELTAGLEYGNYMRGGFLEDLSKFITKEHSKTQFAQFVHNGQYYTIYVGYFDELVITRATAGRNESVPLICIQIEADANAVNLSLMPDLRTTLKVFKGCNALKCESETVYAEVEALYKKL